MRENQEEQTQKTNGGRPYVAVMVEEDGNLKIVGCISEPILAFGLLEAAKQILAISFTQKKKNILTPPAPRIMDFLRRKR